MLFKFLIEKRKKKKKVFIDDLFNRFGSQELYVLIKYPESFLVIY